MKDLLTVRFLLNPCFDSNRLDFTRFHTALRGMVHDLGCDGGLLIGDIGRPNFHFTKVAFIPLPKNTSSTVGY